jgi:hypothetical protein
VRGDDVPSSVGKRQLWLPRAGVERKRVQQHERAPRAGGSARRRLQVPKPSYCWHEAIVNVPASRVESGSPGGCQSGTLSVARCCRRVQYGTALNCAEPYTDWAFR